MGRYLRDEALGSSTTPPGRQDAFIAIDLRGVFLCLKDEIPLMLKQEGGAIVNTSPGAGVKGLGGGVAWSSRTGLCSGHTALAVSKIAIQMIPPIPRQPRSDPKEQSGAGETPWKFGHLTSLAKAVRDSARR